MVGRESIIITTSITTMGVARVVGRSSIGELGHLTLAMGLCSRQGLIGMAFGVALLQSTMNYEYAYERPRVAAPGLDKNELLPIKYALQVQNAITER